MQLCGLYFNKAKFFTGRGEDPHMVIGIPQSIIRRLEPPELTLHGTSPGPPPSKVLVFAGTIIIKHACENLLNFRNSNFSLIDGDTRKLCSTVFCVVTLLSICTFRSSHERICQSSGIVIFQSN